jgi:hypothetical protein
MATFHLNVRDRKLIAECRSRFYPVMEIIIIPFLAVMMLAGCFSLASLVLTQLRRGEPINGEMTAAGVLAVTLLWMTVARFWRLRQLRLLVDKLARHAEQVGHG